MSRSQPEFRLQCVVVDYLTRACPTLLWTAFPAGEARTEKTGGKLKRMGLKPGWPDIIAVKPGGGFLGLELKAEGGRLSPEQKAVLEALEGCGASYAVIRSLDDLKETLAEHGVPTREHRVAA